MAAERPNASSAYPHTATSPLAVRLAAIALAVASKIALVAWVLAHVGPATSQGTAASAPQITASPVASSAAKTVKMNTNGSAWSTLNAAQKTALAPLSNDWGQLSSGQRAKWLHLSQGYALMTPGEQGALNERMRDWAAMSPAQRAQARLNFGDAKKQLNLEERAAQWQAYQALSPQARQQLGEEGRRNQPAGTAPASKVARANKLADVPFPRASGAAGGKNAPKIALQPSSAPANPARSSLTPASPALPTPSAAAQ